MNHTERNNTTIPITRIAAVVVRVESDSLRVRITHEGLPEEMRVRIHCLGVNSEFDETIPLLEPGSRLNLAEVEVVDGELRPQYLVLEPDYLVDASSLAECVQDYGVSWQRYFWNRLRPKLSTAPILLGNAVNLIFDELIHAENPRQVSFQSLMPKIFSRYSIEFAAGESIDRNFFNTLRQQFDTLNRVLETDFPRLGINRRRAMVEPSFICETLGLQGRLDFLQTVEGANGIELKAGRTPYPDYDLAKISLPHRAQSALYQLMWQSVSGIPLNDQHFYLLYSRCTSPGGNLRSVKVSTSELRSLINLRNLIVAAERDTARYGVSQSERLINQLNATNLIPRPSSFTERFIRPEIERGRMRLERRTDNELALRYFHRYYAFVAKEHYLAKVGYPSGSGISGSASWWRMTRDEKVREGYMYSGLQLIRNNASGENPEAEFALPPDLLSPDFRVGDIVLLYCCDHGNAQVSSQQVFRATIATISVESIVLRLRDSQLYAELLPLQSRYAIEHDYVDSSFTFQYKALYALLEASPHRKGLLLGESDEAPTRNEVRKLSYEYPDANLTRILTKAVQANDYFLLVGPPGTGKTSVALRNMVREFLAIPDHQILLVAFTNRAVDEICDKLEAIPEVEDYIRVGQPLSCETTYRHHLLSERMKSCANREAVCRTIDECRVFVATLASLSGRSEFFALKRFDVAIVDEASQILEPQLVGLLSAQTPTGRDAVGKFILIGDHKQLPAIVVQSPEESVISDETLQAAGFTDCRISLFERLYRSLPADSPFVDILDCQWRMHPAIATFANEHFYQGILKNGNAEHQTDELPYLVHGNDSWEKSVATRRLAFFPTESRFPGKKYNDEEAIRVATIVHTLYRLYELNHLTFDERAIGIITPYRHQIARIRQELARLAIPALDTIRIDTVERFQGSQNDCIIYSFCTNDEAQLDWLPSYTEEKGQLIDRKLNVAITRARRQLFVLGNPQLLSRNSIYSKLIDYLGYIPLQNN